MKYSLAIISIILSICVNIGYAQIVYTDVDPDTTLSGYQSAKYIDIDGDNINDFAIFHDDTFDAWPCDSGRVNGVAHFNQNELLCVVAGHMYPKALYYNYLINDPAQEWVNFENNVPLFLYAMVNGEYQNWGYFQNMTKDKYIGVKLHKDGNFFFGWIRIYIHPSGNYMVCKDFAYNSIPNQEIYGGEGIPTGVAEIINIEDVDDFGDGRDVQLSFKKAEDEFTVSQYRLFVVKAKDTAMFTVQKALTIAPGNCTAVLPNGSDHSLNLKESSKDVDGDLIGQNTDYVLYIVSYPKGTRADDHQISSYVPFSLSNSIGLMEAKTRQEYYFMKNQACFINGNEKGVDFIIYDLSGKVVKRYLEVTNTREISGLKKGTYILTILDEGNVNQAKFIILD